MTVEENQKNGVDNGHVKLPEEETLLPDKNENSELPNGTTGPVGNGHEKTTEFKEKSSGGPVRRLSEIAEELLTSGETACGFLCFKGKTLQRFANKKAYVILYGVLGCIMSSSYAYFNGTITTIEKRFKIPSTSTGIIMVGGDISQLFLCMFLNYYGGRGHRPRWIAAGVFSVVIYCILSALPHWLYGAGEDSLGLTEEFGAHYDDNMTALLLEKHNRESMCHRDDDTGKCDDSASSLMPQAILFGSHLISGVGGSLYYTLGVSYMDDNIKKSKTPALVSFSYFLRMLGPAVGYALATFCLSMYISPSFTPTITKEDPRWLGAWWLGWLVIGSLLALFAAILAMFPRSLPRAAARRVLAEERRRAGLLITAADEEAPVDEIPASFHDMMITIKRLFKNKTLMCNNWASVFYFLGYLPYWVFMPKYIETIYKQSASASSFITGTVGLVCSAIGILVSGLFISKFRPSARFLASWNVLVGFISVFGIVSYAFLGCPVNDQQGTILESGELKLTVPCNSDCHCDYVKYSPVCSPDGRTFISPCHAGCNDYQILANGIKVYSNCSCSIPETKIASTTAPRTLREGTEDTWSLVTTEDTWSVGPLEPTKAAPPRAAPRVSTEGASSTATPWVTTELTEDTPPATPWVLKEGACPVDCTTTFYIFLSVVCLLKFSGATGRTSNFLVSVRCVGDKDKAVGMALGVMLMSIFAFIPSPILFGFLIDKTCMVWGKTCSGKGNCWLYNPESLRYTLNFTSAVFVAIGTCFDLGVWFYVKNLKIFDEEVELEVAPQRAKTQRK